MEEKAKKVILSAIMGQIEALVDDAYAQGVEAGSAMAGTDSVKALLGSMIDRCRDLQTHATSAHEYADEVCLSVKSKKGRYVDDTNVVPDSSDSLSKICTFIDDHPGHVAVDPYDTDAIQGKEDVEEATERVSEKVGMMLVFLEGEMRKLNE
jgi:hypothetical protein